jgi:hypothetical protein
MKGSEEKLKVTDKRDKFLEVNLEPGDIILTRDCIPKMIIQNPDETYTTVSLSREGIKEVRTRKFWDSLQGMKSDYFNHASDATLIKSCQLELVIHDKVKD